MVKQKKHIRELKGKPILSGRGTNNSLVGNHVKYTRYPCRVYLVMNQNKNGTYNIKDIKTKEVQNNVGHIYLIRLRRI